MPTPNGSEQDLCLLCGMCCNGVLFRDVELQSGDDPKIYEDRGFQLEHLRRKIRFAQPCPALGADCHCAIYQQRPGRCRQFNCRLVQSLRGKNITFEAGVRVVRHARKRTAEVFNLMRELGDRPEQLPLTERFRRLRIRMESCAVDYEHAAIFARLSRAVHKLNVLLQSRFL